MSAFLYPGLTVRIQEMNGGPKPWPIDSGFRENHQYKVLGLYTPSETAEAWFILANDRDEIWFISNRHLRVINEKTA